jgi:hypothetical protein
MANFDIGTMGDYFEGVDGFFEKGFREDAKLSLAAKSTKYAGAVGESPSLKVSPAFAVDHDGNTVGKFKVGCSATSRLCQLNQRLAIRTDGVVTAKLGLVGQEREDGQSVEADAQVDINTVAPPTEDVASVELRYNRADAYAAAGLTKASDGRGESTLAAGVRLFSGIFGVELSRPTVATALAASYELAVGGGFHGEDWSVGAKVAMDDSSVTSAAAALQRQHKSAAIFAKYELDLQKGAGNAGTMTLGVQQNWKLRVPLWLRWYHTANDYTKVSVAGKIGSDGGVAVRAVAPGAGGVRYGVTAVWADAAQQGFVRPQLGFSVRIETEE